MRLFVITSLLLVIIFLPAYFLTLSPGHGIPRDGTSLVVGRDFLNIWMYGRAAWGHDPARYYDIATYLAALGQQVGGGYPGQLWSYPPTALLVAAPFGLLPYLPALLLWTLLGLVALAIAVRLWTRDGRIVALVVASPACLFGLMSGQFACFAAAILLAILRWRQSRPVLAGALIVLLWWRFRQRPAADDIAANALFLACAISATPYLLAYDSLALAAMAVLLAARGWAGDIGRCCSIWCRSCRWRRVSSASEARPCCRSSLPSS